MEENDSKNNEDDNDSSSDELKIVLDDDKDVKIVQSKKRKRTETTDSSDEDDSPLPENCIKVEESLCTTAAKNHLTAANVKNILKRVVTNEHVLAIVKLREEEMEDEEEIPEPKITRSKAKELKKITPDMTWPLPLTPVKVMKVTSPEVTKLIEKDLPDEESDEEYQPTPDEHDGSDDERDTLGSLSDADSQPRTPKTPGSIDFDLSPIKYTEDGVFKVPKDVTNPDEKSEPTIALRTRSKLCLSDQAIEEIENSFVPPDDVEAYPMDNDWSEFLAEFINPETPPEPTNDDEANDPEYNASAESEMVDLEELREDKAVKVSRKELNDLVAELFDIEDVFGIQEPMMMASNSHMPPMNLSPNASLQTPVKNSPIKLLDISQSSHILQHNSIEEKNCIDEIAQNISLTAENIEQMNKTQTPPNVKVETGSVTVAKRVPVTAPLSIKVEVLDNERRVISSSVELITTVTDKIIKNEPTPVVEKCSQNDDDSDVEEVVDLTPKQHQILDQQMRQHVQIVTQCFLQLHGHPELWKHGPKQMEYLNELKELGANKPNSAFIPCNLLPAIELCKKWQSMLLEDTQEMRDMMQFIVNENLKAIKRHEQSSVYYMKFPKEYFETVVNSNVFIYPHLLPFNPFRAEMVGKCEYSASEDHLIALGIEQFNEYINANPKLYNKIIPSHRFKKLAGLISTYIIRSRGESALTSRIRLLKRQDSDNPVKYYFKHGCAPKTEHTIIPFDPSKTPRDHPLTDLPKAWRLYLNPTSRVKNNIVERLGALSATLESKKNCPAHLDSSNATTQLFVDPNTLLISPLIENSQIRNSNNANYQTPILSQPNHGVTPSKDILQDQNTPNKLNNAYYHVKPVGSNQYVFSPIVDRDLGNSLHNKVGIPTQHKPTETCTNTTTRIPAITSDGAIHMVNLDNSSIRSPLITNRTTTIPAITNDGAVHMVNLNNSSISSPLITNTRPIPALSLVLRDGQLFINNNVQSPALNVNGGQFISQQCVTPAVRSDNRTEPPIIPQLAQTHSQKPISNEIPQFIISSDESSNSCESINLISGNSPSNSPPSSPPKQPEQVSNSTKKNNADKNRCSNVDRTCCHSGCSIEDEELPKNQTLLTQFFKKTVKNKPNPVCSANCGKEITSESVILEWSQPNVLDLTENSSITDPEQNEHIKQEELIIEHVPFPSHDLTGDTSSVDEQDQSNPEEIELFSSYKYEYNNEHFTLRTVLSKLKHLFKINRERKALFLKKSNQKHKLKSHIAWRVRAKLFNEIQEVENNMLPSMPNLTTPSKSCVDGQDESNLIGVPVIPECDSPDVQITPPIVEDDVKKGVEKASRPLRNPPRSGISGQSTKHRLAARAQRELEANKAMFATSDPYVEDFKDSLYVTAFLEKVQSRLNGNLETYITNKYVEFQDMLESFDPEKETPCDLYRNLEKFFGPENEDLTEEFLTFLTAGQAVEVGRFMDHFMLTNMSDFIERLQIYFARRPAQLRKILWCLERIVENIDRSTDSVTIESIKATILPHLKGNKHLVNWFLKLFPTENPPESQTNNSFEVIDVESLTKNLETPAESYLDSEILNIPPIEDNYGNESCVCSCHNTSDDKLKVRARHCIACGMKYMQGRLYIQHGKCLRAARVEWGGEAEGAEQARRLSAPPTHHSSLPHVNSSATTGKRRATSIDPPHRDSDEERVSPRRVVKIVRTPTSKTKHTRIPRNSIKSNDAEEAMSKPSCSKSIIRDENLADNPFRGGSREAEQLAEALPQGEERLEPTQEVSPQDYGIEAMNVEPSSISVRNSPSQSEPLQSSEITNSTIVKTEHIELPCDDFNINMDIDAADLSESTPNIKLEDEQTWTREEDKAILMVLQCESDSDYTFEKIQRILPHRSIGEIRDRFQNVMKLLQQMASDST